MTNTLPLHATYLLRCLRTTKDLQLVYKRNRDSNGRQPEVWVDAVYAPDCGDWADNYRSTSAWLVLSNNTGEYRLKNRL